MAISENRKLSKTVHDKSAETFEAAEIKSYVQQIVWNESPKMKLAMVFGVPSSERFEFLNEVQDNGHDDHLQRLIYKYADIINELIQKHC